MCQIFTNLKNWFQQIFFPDEEEFIRRYIESMHTRKLTPEEKEHLYAILEGREEQNRVKLIKQKVKNNIFKDGIYKKDLGTMTNGTCAKVFFANKYIYMVFD